MENLKIVTTGEVKVHDNFKEVREYLKEKTAGFDTLVVSNENIKLAKEYRAKTNKYIEEVKEAMKRVKQQLLLPFSTFENDALKLIEELEKTKNSLDIQIKNMEIQAKNEKKKEVMAYFESITTKEEREELPFVKIENSSWYNFSTSKRKYQRDIDEIMRRHRNDMKLINAEEPVFRNEMLKVYKETGSISDAILKKQDMVSLKETMDLAERQNQQRMTAAMAAEKAIKDAKQERTEKKEGVLQSETVVPKKPKAPAAPLFGTSQTVPKKPKAPAAPLFGTSQAVPNMPDVSSKKYVPSNTLGDIDAEFTYIISILRNQKLDNLGVESLFKLEALKNKVVNILRSM